MRFHSEVSYDAPPEEVRAMLTDPAFRRKVATAQHAVSVQVEVLGSGEAVTVSVDTSLPTSGVPAFARTFVGDTLRVLRTETWTGPDSARLDLTVPGKPARLNGTLLLTGSGTATDTAAGRGTGTLETVVGDLSVSVPMVGGKLERLVSEVLLRAQAKQQEVGRAWLAGAR
jgi:hypothetical protein